MIIGAISNYIDVAQIVLYGFWIFFAGLIFYLRREDKREGYPLESDRSSDRVMVQGFPAIPDPKVFLLSNGETQEAPRAEPEREFALTPVAPWPGAPLMPTGDPMKDGVGPASYALRADVPDVTAEGENKIAPLRLLSDYLLETRDPDPRGMEVMCADNQVAGTETDVWVDRGEPQIRYYEVEVPLEEGSRQALLPVGFARILGGRIRPLVRVESIFAHHFADVPATKSPDQITRLEEDQICGYFAGGHLYAHPWREESML